MKTFLQGPKKKWWIANLCNGGLVQYPTTQNVLLYEKKKSHKNGITTKLENNL